MARVKRGTIALKKRRKLLREVKGFRGGRKNREKLAKEALLKKWTHQFRSRRLKKRDTRAAWNININAASRTEGLSYSHLIDKLKKANVKLNRKILSELADKHPEVFANLVKQVS
jgi:large subunit ribosomal protein L20